MTDFQNSLNNSLVDLKKSFSLDQIAISPLRNPVSIEFYEKWIAQGYQGGMAYLVDQLPFKKNPELLHTGLKSAISVGQSYFPTVKPTSLNTPARVALYAHNDDYHFWLKEKLQKLIVDLQTQYPEEVFLPYVDSGPVLERDLAYQAGLGWFGKNSCLIHPEHGSLFFIAEILTTLPAPIEEIEPLPDFCGKCRKCMDICPTQAIVEPRVVRAELCISYLTIESKDVPPVELRKKIGDWFFGCDLCQTVCPWNEKVFRKKAISPSQLTSTAALLELNADERLELVTYFRFLLNSSHKKIQKFHHGSPLSRAGARGLKRNALIVAANRNLTELSEDIRNLTHPELQELSRWALQSLH